MTLPNLVGCGAGKSGTTSLYYYLSQHPEIYMAAVKEVHYFSRHYGLGESWYESHFAGSDNAAVIGEFSTSYMLDPAVPERLASLLPNARLLFIFRNPIDRAYSNYWFSLSIGTETRAGTFSELLRTPEGFNKYIAGGFYYQYLQQFLGFFAPEQIYVMITEEVQRAPLQQMALCYKYLGVDSTFQPDTSKTYNVTVTTSNKWLAAGYSSWMMAKTRLKPFVKRFPGQLRRHLAQVEKQTIQRALSDERPDILTEDRAFLGEIYADQNKKLAEFMGRDLLYW